MSVLSRKLTICYKLSWSDTDVRQLDENGKLPPVGSVINPEVTDPSKDTGAVNTETAEWTNTIGAVELAQVWTDRDFDPSPRAFYYARGLEIPTPRWTDHDKVFFGEEWCAEAKAEDPTACDDIRLTLQERVYTSPIWYSPAWTKRFFRTSYARILVEMAKTLAI